MNKAYLAKRFLQQTSELVSRDKMLLVTQLGKNKLEKYMDGVWYFIDKIGVV